jgi:prevent-host-death family protein
MRRYSLYEAKTRLSALVKQVREGQAVVITVHGEPVAELRPYEAPEPANTLESRIRELESRGALLPARRKDGRKSIPPIVTKPGAVKRFLEERD